MQGTVWREVIARIPEKHHSKLGVLTTVGVEITVQSFVSIEEEYLVIRGRLSGSSDTGRLFFVPFDQISYVGILKLMAENEIEEMFAKPDEKAVQGETPVVEETAPGETSEEEPEPELNLEPAAEDERSRSAHTPVKFPNRKELLARIKNRSQQSHPQRTPPNR